MGVLDQPPVPAGFTGTRLGVCNLCEAICGLTLTIEDGAVTSIRGNPDDPLSRGYICPKGVSLADVYADPDRLRRPVRRDGDDWVEMDWDDALDLVADRLAATIAERGGDAVGVYLGNPNAHSLGFGTHGAGFVRSLQTHNRFSASTVDQVPHQLVAWQLYGHQFLIPVPDLDRTSYFLVVGANPMASNGSLMTVPDFPQRVRDLHARGGRMVVLDPRRTETAKVADEHHFVRPGTDAPRVACYLEKYRAVLEARRYVIEGGRQWFEIWVPQNPVRWPLPKLVFPDISEKPTFWIDLDGSVVNGDRYWLTTNDPAKTELLWLAVAVGNSSFAEEFYDHQFHNKLYSGRRRFMTQHVEKFPLPDHATPLAKEIIACAKTLFEPWNCGKRAKKSRPVVRESRVSATLVPSVCAEEIA